MPPRRSHPVLRPSCARHRARFRVAIVPLSRATVASPSRQFCRVACPSRPLAPLHPVSRPPRPVAAPPPSRRRRPARRDAVTPLSRCLAPLLVTSLIVTPSHPSPAVSRPPCTVAAPPRSSRRRHDPILSTLSLPSPNLALPPRAPIPRSRPAAVHPHPAVMHTSAAVAPSRSSGVFARPRSPPSCSQVLPRAAISNPPHCRRAPLTLLAATRLLPRAVAPSSRTATPLSRAAATPFGGVI
ncbi:hypothetical protein DENSPDRAFT_887398 [Dentipellis sp. KUC8613]|nr:hypothetical protein DENSPDRAFT_887398 [Dentipellis sp. KUC8613]